MNIFDVLNRGNSRLKEPSISAMLGYLLDSRENHGFGKQFINELMCALDNNYANKLSIVSHTEVELESQYQNNNKRSAIDIEIRFLNSANKEITRLLIENKINDNSSKSDQLQEYFEAVKRETEGQIPLIFLFITPGTESKIANDEFNNLIIKEPVHSKYWLTWTGEKMSICTIIRDILMKESIAEINPINDYLKHTLKSLVMFVEGIAKPKIIRPDVIENGGMIDSVSLNIGVDEYRIERYESNTILCYINGIKMVAMDTLRKIIKAKNINITDDEIKKSNTRNIGKRVIEAIKAT